MGSSLENEEIVTLRQLLVLKETRLAEAMAEIEQLRRHIAAEPRGHAVPAGGASPDAADDARR